MSDLAVQKKLEKKARKEARRAERAAGSCGTEGIKETNKPSTDVTTTATCAVVSSRPAKPDTKPQIIPPKSSVSSVPVSYNATTNSFPYVTDPADHAETPLDAYSDILPILKSLAHQLHKTPSTLRIYDPYYCGGTIKTHFATLGYTNVYNEKEDFYAHADHNAEGPGDYDVLITNPPYSGSHVERLFKYCCKNPDKPFLLLLPMYFYTESYYSETIGKPANLHNLFFICPGLGRRYGYTPPAWSGVDRDGPPLAPIAPFPTFWFCSVGSHAKAVLKRWKAVNEKGKVEGRLEFFSQEVFMVRTTGELPNELKSEFDLARKRANPKQRAKMAKRRAEMVGGSEFVKKPPNKKAAEWRQKAQARLKEERSKQT